MNVSSPRAPGLAWFLGFVNTVAGKPSTSATGDAPATTLETHHQEMAGPGATADGQRPDSAGQDDGFSDEYFFYYLCDPFLM